MKAKAVPSSAAYLLTFLYITLRNPNDPTSLGAYWPQYTADREEYMGLGPNMTVRFKMLPDKMALWNELIPSIGETANPTTSSDMPTTTEHRDEKKGMYTLKCNTFDESC